MTQGITSRFPPALSYLPLIHQGKTRDTFPAMPGYRLIVATNRLSTHDVVHKSEVPHKGEVLTALTIFWIKEVLEPAGIPHHLAAYGKDVYGGISGKREDYPENLHHRAIVVGELEMIPVEFIVRARLMGSLYKNYYVDSKHLKPNPYGIELSPDLSLMSEFDPPIFTPTDKSETDDPINSLETARRYTQAYSLMVKMFTLARKYLSERGIDLCDSKFEFGFDRNGLVRVGDEIFTPDSSRYSESLKIVLGQEPPWLDKQIARNEAQRIWGKEPKYPLEFSSEIIEGLSRTYLDIFSRITGMSLGDFQKKFLD